MRYLSFLGRKILGFPLKVIYPREGAYFFRRALSERRADFFLRIKKIFPECVRSNWRSKRVSFLLRLSFFLVMAKRIMELFFFSKDARRRGFFFFY